jgi:hypothetical protein
LIKYLRGKSEKKTFHETCQSARKCSSAGDERSENAIIGFRHLKQNKDTHGVEKNGQEQTPLISFHSEMFRRPIRLAQAAQPDHTASYPGISYKFTAYVAAESTEESNSVSPKSPKIP